MQAVFYIVLLVLVALAAVAIVSVFRGLARRGGPASPDAGAVSFLDLPAPAPVSITPGVLRVGWLAVLWALLNFVVLLAWAAGGLVMTGSLAGVHMVVRVTLLAYMLVAILYAAAGGVFLVHGRALGRQLLSWAGYLLTVFGVLGGGILLLARTRATSAADRQLAGWALAGLVVHLAVDVVLAAIAQRVGAPGRAGR